MMGRLVVLKVCLTLVLTMFRMMCSSKAEEAPPAIFVFGDSLVDVGNNNYLLTLVKANFDPNGIDFGSPTGRFNNGRTVLDIIGQELGSGLAPPYLAPNTSGTAVLRGVNYASAGSGILSETGQLYIDRISLDAQIDNFANTRQDIISSIGDAETEKLLQKAIFSLTTGANDLLLSKQDIISNSTFSPEQLAQYVGTLMSKLGAQLTRLFNLGARKIVVANIGPLGCMPCQRDRNPSPYMDKCARFPNEVAQLFNAQLKTLLSNLTITLHGSFLIYADAYHIGVDIIQNYRAYGFENPSSACCAVAGQFGGMKPCLPETKVCVNRSKYVFWDAFHPSDAANVIIANRLLDSTDLADISPINLRQLIALSSSISTSPL